nr:alpha/beta hydrolase [Thermoleophilaceae bacterium]
MTLRTVEAAGLEFAAEERGEGPGVVFVHPAGFDRTVWEATIASLGPRVRSIAYDRRGYGTSEAPAPYSGTTIEEQSEDLAAIVEDAGSPAVLAGQGTGAMIVLDLMRRRPELVPAAVLADPPLLALSATGPARMSALRDELEESAGEGEDMRLAGIDLHAETNWEFTRGSLRAIAAPARVLRGEGANPALADAADALAALLPEGELLVSPGPGPA